MTKLQPRYPATAADKSGETNDLRKIIRVLIADDHAIVREGTKVLIERESGISVIAEASTGEEAVQLASTYLPDVILMDISMKGSNGLQAAHTILIRHPEVKIIILSMADNDEFVQHALQIGIQGYVLKESLSKEVIRAIKEVVLNGNPYYSPAVQKKALKIVQTRTTGKGESELAPKVELTPRELEVLQLVVDGKTNVEIGKALFISSSTAQKHRQHLMDKLDIHDRIGLTRYAIRRGISKA